MSSIDNCDTIGDLDRPGGPDWVPVEEFGLTHNPFAKMSEKARAVISQKVYEYKHYKIFGRIKEVPLSAIRWTLQASVDRERVMAYARGEGDPGKPMVLTRKEITLIEYRNSYLLLDGNHRISALRYNNTPEDAMLSVVVVEC